MGRTREIALGDIRNHPLIAVVVGDVGWSNIRIANLTPNLTAALIAACLGAGGVMVTGAVEELLPQHRCLQSLTDSATHRNAIHVQGTADTPLCTGSTKLVLPSHPRLVIDFALPPPIPHARDF